MQPDICLVLDSPLEISQSQGPRPSDDSWYKHWNKAREIDYDIQAPGNEEASESATQLYARFSYACESHILETFPHARNPTEHPASGEWPHWKEVWKEGSHIDVQLTSDDFDATPRREQLVMWLWLSDVTEDSGAMVSDHHPFLCLFP